MIYIRTGLRALNFSCSQRNSAMACKNARGPCPALTSSTFLRRNRPDGSREARMHLGIDGSVPGHGTGRIFTQIIISLPIHCRPDGTRRKAATAIRTDVVQDGFDTVSAKRALIGANTRLRRIGWKGLVTVLAARSQFQHHTAPNLGPRRESDRSFLSR